MAKRGKMSMEMDMPAYDWGGGLLSIVMVALGIWFLVGGFFTQFNVSGRNFDWMVGLWYLIGVALVMYGKMWYHRACCY